MKSESSEKKALIQYRMKRARSTLRASQLLYKQGGDSASIINRAYYAMFYAALALLVTIGQESSKHQGVLALFDQHFIKPKILPKEMGKFLHHAFDTRQIGDYEEEAELTKEQAFQILESAIQFINSIEEKLSTNS
ncbi:MAG TPA: HEPN domain-containing protein [Anaerolineales bacterium]|nr:HEPN domain-containing protein [Anaerolineales bacterium]